MKAVYSVLLACFLCCICIERKYTYLMVWQLHLADICEGNVKSIVELIGFDVGTLLLGTIMTSVALTPLVYV